MTPDTLSESPGASTSATILQALDFVLIALSFWAALWLYLNLVDPLAPEFPPVSTGLKMLGVAFIFWFVPKISSQREYGVERGNLFPRFCLSAGVVMIAQAAMLYAFHLQPFPLLVIAGGGLLASVLLGLSETWVSPRFARFRFGAVIVGCDAVVRELIDSLDAPVFGVVDSDPSRVPAGFSFLGTMPDLWRVVATLRPSQIVVGARDWALQLPPARLLDLRLAGIVVRDAASVYEQVLHRVSTERLDAHELLFSQSMRTKRSVMALQSVYTNLAGLLLVLCALPVLALAALFLRCFSRGGPIIDRIDCVGFQGVPFERLRFRTRGIGSAGETFAGKVISRLGLAGLPQLFNVTRGEMALVGPAPVRTEFVGWFSERMPFYFHRFSVRPGLFGWAQVNLHFHRKALAEPLGLEYDLYYVKYGSLPLDLEILLRTALSYWRLLRRPPQRYD